jgi:hypothetical protein
MWMVAGFASQLLGLWAWRAARADHGSARPVAMFCVGLGLLAASVAIFLASTGLSLGLGWALLTMSIAAYAVVFPPLARARAIGRDKFRARPPVREANRGGRLGLVLRLVSAGPLYLVAALAIGAVVATQMPWAEVNRLMTGGLLVPFIWALGALHATADLALARVLGAPVALAILFGGLFLWA